MTPDTAGHPAPPSPTKRDDVIVHELDGEAVLYDERSGAVHRFNEAALKVWKACDGSRSALEISRDLAKRYALGADEARNEVEKVLGDFETQCLLVEGADRDGLARHRLPGHATSHDDRCEGTDNSKNPSASKLPSRRELLRSGAGKLIYAAPVIATLFATEARAAAYNFSCYDTGHACPGNEACCDGLTCCNNPGTCGTSTFLQPCNVNADCCNGFCFLGFFCTG